MSQNRKPFARCPDSLPELVAELTSFACNRIAEVASKWLEQECDPFVMPALSRRVMRSESMVSRLEDEPWEPLEDADSQGLVLGQLPPDQNRVRIFSQSGMGKTTLLRYCELQVARGAEGRLPIRVSDLSSYDWRGDVPVTLVNRVLHPFLPADTDEATRVEWLRQLIREHRVVFLFDASAETARVPVGAGSFAGELSSLAGS